MKLFSQLIIILYFWVTHVPTITAQILADSIDIRFERFIIDYKSNPQWCNASTVKVELTCVNKSNQTIALVSTVELDLCQIPRQKAQSYSLTPIGDTLYWIPDLGYRQFVLYPKSIGTLRMTLSSSQFGSISDILITNNYLLNEAPMYFHSYLVYRDEGSDETYIFEKKLSGTTTDMLLLDNWKLVQRTDSL